MDSLTEKSYVNTLIFTIISAIISVCLLILLLLGALGEYAYFVIGVEVGIFAIIAYCIYKIWKSSKCAAKTNPILHFNSCPDFYTQRTDNEGQPYCANEHAVKDAYGNQSILKTYPTSVGLPSQLDQTPPTLGAPTKYEKFYLHELADAPDLPTSADKCGAIFNAPTSSNSPYVGYDVVPWSSVRSACWPLVNS